MEFGEILELEIKNQERQLKSRLSQAKYENQQRSINQGISIISMQMHQNTMALLSGIFSDK